MTQKQANRNKEQKGETDINIKIHTKSNEKRGKTGLNKYYW
jgi:hypothetical protein